MIELLKFNGDPLWVNPDLVQTYRGDAGHAAAADDGLTLMVQEEPVVIVQRILDYRRAEREARAEAQAPFRLIDFSEDA